MKLVMGVLQPTDEHRPYIDRLVVAYFTFNYSDVSLSLYNGTFNVKHLNTF